MDLRHNWRECLSENCAMESECHLPHLFTCDLDEVCHLSYHTLDFQRDVAQLIILKANN